MIGVLGSQSLTAQPLREVKWVSQIFFSKWNWLFLFGGWRKGGWVGTLDMASNLRIVSQNSAFQRLEQDRGLETN